MRQLMQLLSLSDSYERKARLLPGLLAAAPITFTVMAIAADKTPWYVTFVLSAGVELVLGFILAHLARAGGKAAEESMWAEWGGPPTTRWLRPDDTTCSDQQKSRWRGAIKRITNLAIPASATATNGAGEIDRVINDATRQLRNKLRDWPGAKMVQIHNEEYGQVRNLYGIRWYWIGAAVVALLGCFGMLFTGRPPWVGFCVAGVSLVLAVGLVRALPRYIRQCADRYAESLFAAAVAFDEKAAPPAAPSNPAQPAASPAAPEKK